MLILQEVIDRVIPRYTTEEMARIWSDENRFATWLRVEILVCEALAKRGRIPEAALRRIKRRARFDMKRIEEIEKEVKHDVVAFLTSVAENVGRDSRYIHMGLTSSDVIDTAFAVLLKEAAELIIEDLKELLVVLKKRALEHKDTVMIGRSHGVHAEPTTLGLKFAVFYQEMRRNLERMERARDVVSCGKLSGAVGTFSNIEPYVERYVMRRLGLTPEPAATQVVQRDRHAEFFLTLSVIASSVEKIAVEIRHLQRTEVLEAEEPFTSGQKGSSAMPHKRNPILSENLTGLSRLVRGYAVSSLENIALWHERDISHSSVERVIAPDATIVVDFMLKRLTGVLEGLVVYPERMKRNLELLKGLVFSQRVLLKLVEKGMTREDAYRIVQRCAMKVWKEEMDFREVLKKDEDAMALLKPQEIDSCFKLKPYLEHIDYIFKRVFV